MLQSAKHKPSPIDAYFGGIYYIGPIFGAFRGTDEAIDYYRFLREEVEQRVRKARVRSRRTATWARGVIGWWSKVRRTTNFRQFWKMFYDEGAVVVASSYTKVGGTYDFGFRHNPDKPLGVARGILPQCLHEPEPAAACRHARELRQRVRGGRIADQLDQELQQLLGRPASHHARVEKRTGNRRPSSRPISSIPAISRRRTSRTVWRAISR